MPRDLREMIMRQIDRPDRRRARSCSKSRARRGRTFSALLVAGALDRDVLEVEQICEELARTGRVVASAGVTEWPNGGGLWLLRLPTRALPGSPLSATCAGAPGRYASARGRKSRTRVWRPGARGGLRARASFRARARFPEGRALPGPGRRKLGAAVQHAGSRKLPDPGSRTCDSPAGGGASGDAPEASSSEGLGVARRGRFCPLARRSYVQWLPTRSRPDIFEMKSMGSSISADFAFTSIDGNACRSRSRHSAKSRAIDDRCIQGAGAGQRRQSESHAARLAEGRCRLLPPGGDAD